MHPLGVRTPVTRTDERARRPVKPTFHAKNLSDPLRRRIELAIAVAQERLLATHVEHALRLLDLVGDYVPFDHALPIYTRLLRLSEDEARVITTRALAILGERAAGGDPWPELEADSGEMESDDGRGPLSFIHQVRQRVRGRVNEELRRWIEVSAAATEVAVLVTHVDNAINFVDVLEKEMPFSEAIELYLDALGVRDSIAEVTYYTATAKLKDRILPAKKQPEERPEPRGQGRGSGGGGEERRLRVVEGERARS